MSVLWISEKYYDVLYWYYILFIIKLAKLFSDSFENFYNELVWQKYLDDASRTEFNLSFPTLSQIRSSIYNWRR